MATSAVAADSSVRLLHGCSSIFRLQMATIIALACLTVAYRHRKIDEWGQQRLLHIYPPAYCVSNRVFLPAVFEAIPAAGASLMAMGPSGEGRRDCRWCGDASRGSQMGHRKVHGSASAGGLAPAGKTASAIRRTVLNSIQERLSHTCA